MVAVRYVALAALAAWLGGIAALWLIVGPATARVLETNPAAGPILAGAMATEVLRSYHRVAFVSGAVILLSLLVIKFVGPPPRAFKLRTVLVAVMLAISFYTGVPLTRELAQLRAVTSGPLALREADASNRRYERLQSTMTALVSAKLTIGLVLLCWYVRE